MKIKVKSLQSDEYIVDVQNDQLVSEMKACISEKANGLAIARQKLVYKGRTMQDTSPVGDYNLEEGCKVHLILQKDTPTNLLPSPVSFLATSNSCHNMDSSSSRLRSNVDTIRAQESDLNMPQSRFEIILREKLAKHFAPDSVKRIMANLQHEINADINSSSLDDLERLAKQKLNINNE